MNTAKATLCEKKQQPLRLQRGEFAYVLDSMPILPQSVWLGSVFLSPPISWFTRTVTRFSRAAALPAFTQAPYLNKSLNTLVFMIGIGKNLRLISPIRDLSRIGAVTPSLSQFLDFDSNHTGASQPRSVLNCDLFGTSGGFWSKWLTAGRSFKAAPLLSQEAY